MEAMVQKPPVLDDDRKRPSFVDTVKTVLWGAFGIRRRAGHERASLKPLHLVVAAVIFAVLFIFTLLAIVKIVLS